MVSALRCSEPRREESRMASKQEKEDGSVNTQTFACSPGQILKKEEDEEG